MAVAFDAVGPSSSGAGSSSATTLTWSHTITGLQTVLLAAVALDAGSDSGLSTTATYNGNAMTSLLPRVHSGNVTAGYLEVFGIIAPAGTANVVVTAAGGTPAGLSGGSLSFTGAGQTLATAFGTPASANTPAGTTTPTAALASNTNGNLIAGFCCSGSSFTSATSPSTSRFMIGNTFTGAAGSSAGATSPATGSSVTMAWLLGGSDDFAEILVEVRPFSGGGQFEMVPQQISRLQARRRKSSQWQQFAAQSPDVTVSVSAVAATASIPTPFVPSNVPYITGLAGGGTGYFADQNGSPRLVIGDAAWALCGNAGRWNSGNWQADFDTYLSNRSGQGYTVIYAKPIGTTQSANIDDNGVTFDGLYPFQGGTPATGVAGANPSTGLTSSFWARIDYFLNSAAAKGITVFLNAIGYSSDFTGGPGPLAGKSTTEFTAYGTALGSRYAAQANLVWLLADDYFSSADSSITAFLTGVRGAGDTHVVAIENIPESDSRWTFDSTPVAQAWGTANAQYSFVYSYNATYVGVEMAYAEASPIPVILGDGYFYQSTSSTYSGLQDRAMRQDCWWALSSGARGAVQGSESIWQWPSTALSRSGTDYWYNHVGAIRTLVESLPGWHLLLPDASSVLVTAGRGTHATTFASGGSGGQLEPAVTDTYVSASRVPDGSLALIYMSHATTITIDQTKMVTGYQAWWADPVTGVKTLTTSGTTYNSTAHGNNSVGDPDWVLVLQAAPDTGLAPGQQRARTLQSAGQGAAQTAVFT